MPALLAIIVQGILWVFKSRIGSILASALLWLGISYGTQKIAIEPAMDLVRGFFEGMASASSLGAVAFNWVGVLRFDVAVTMILSAYATKAAVQASKLVFKKA